MIMIMMIVTDSSSNSTYAYHIHTYDICYVHTTPYCNSDDAYRCHHRTERAGREERNAQLRTEKDHIAKHFQELEREATRCEE